ncbi:hypothetical protein BTHE68_39860 [Burkholderia sp. THE68]|uniref:helix-turn-helix domain-containing protein n=1 Tax=Burkholderia sp. THE68 TaxID=758782 RepID=UPI0013184219|nr:hypothetical protein BTHE68_39860 [Burkholderia sp. THE68]
MAEPCQRARTLFAEAVQLQREQQGLSKASLAFKAKISPNTLHLIENKNGNVRVDTIGQLAYALRVDPCSFFSDCSYPKPTARRIKNLRHVVAVNIRMNRADLGLVQSQMNSDLQMAKGHLGLIERSAPNLSLDTIEQIAIYLTIPIEALLWDSLMNCRTQSLS